MKHKLYYDGKIKIVILEVSGEYTVEDARETIKLLSDSFTDKVPYPLLIDLSNLTGSLDKETRKLLQAGTTNIGASRVALAVANPIIRMTGKVIIAAMGKEDESGFFKTTEEAMAWLKG